MAPETQFQVEHDPATHLSPPTSVGNSMYSLIRSTETILVSKLLDVNTDIIKADVI